MACAVQPQQPPWKIAFEPQPGRADASRFVEVNVTVQVEVVDEQTVRALASDAVRRNFGEEPDAYLLDDLAVCVGHAVSVDNVLVGVAGIRLLASSSSTDHFAPEADGQLRSEQQEVPRLLAEAVAEFRVDEFVDPLPQVTEQ